MEHHTTQIKSPTGDMREIAGEALGVFAASLDGSLLYSDDAGFAEVTHIWNAMPQRQPALAVRAKSTRDIVRTVDFVRDNGLEVSVKGGGHHIAGLALSDGGVTLDLSRMKNIEVDVEARLARVGPGCTAGEVDRATQEHGLATTLGFVSETGAGGLTLGGGFGYLSRRFGWTVDDLEEVEIVTADGTLRHASRTVNEDLFWALRGGGGNFGVVTEFTFRLHEVGPQVTAGMIAWPAAEADGVLDLYRRVTESAPRELTVAALMRNAPPAPWLPESAHGAPMIALLVCHSGSPEQAATDLAPIRAYGEPLADIIKVKECALIQGAWPADAPVGDAYRTWVGEAWGALKVYSTGGNYVNFQTEDETDERTLASYRDNYARLETIKAKYDPSNLFRVNRNIRPPV